MGLLFWPGVIVNEINGNKAEDNADERLTKVVGLFEDKKCDVTALNKLEAKIKAEQEAKKSAENNKS